jgi:hypothetical protein
VNAETRGCRLITCIDVVDWRWLLLALGGARADWPRTGQRAPACSSARRSAARKVLEIANVASYSTFREVAYGGSFEGYTTIGLGVRARLPMRVFPLPGPANGDRFVVDVAHHW